jgi:hypothetical protein
MTFEDQVKDYADGRDDGRTFTLEIGSREDSVYVRLRTKEVSQVLAGELTAEQAERAIKGLQDAIRNISSR